MPLSEKKKFLNWIKSHPNCSHIREQAMNTEVTYDPENPNASQIIKIFDTPNHKKKTSFIKNIIDNIWVPGYKLRGNSYSDENYDNQLNQTSSIMSISAIFDMICTAPILFYFTKAAGLFALPLSLGYGYMLLIMSNKAGEFSMNRPKGSNSTANFLLLIFFLLSMIKTLMSGVGIDLVSRSGEIKNNTAKEFLTSYKPIYEEPKIAYPNLLESSTKECERLVSEQSKLNPQKRGQRKLYNELQGKMFRNESGLDSSDPRKLIDNNLSALGPCLKKDLINNLNGKNSYDKVNAFSITKKLKENLPPISFLYIFQRNQFNDTFNGNPLIGSESNFKFYEKELTDNNIEFSIQCVDNIDDCQKNVEWRNPGKAINSASKQFYSKIFNKDWENLGLSYVGFLISILLSATATILLYTASIDIKNRASRSGLMQDWREDYFLELEEEDSNE
tara:strand:- start:1093 stop:2433 length:1341 start_codon:yes stop_codon:yes gene_type:complete